MTSLMLDWLLSKAGFRAWAFKFKGLGLGSQLHILTQYAERFDGTKHYLDDRIMFLALMPFGILTATKA